MSRFQRFANGKFSGILLNLLLPGAGHIYFREHVFGLFVLLIWLIAASLYYLSFVIHLNQWAKLILFGLPLVFYFFTFLDLLQSLKKKKEFKRRSASFSIALYGTTLLFQLLAPVAPLNFMMTNGPIPFVLEDHRLSPLYSQGTLMKASRLDYQIKIIGFSRPIFHHFPERYDLVRIQSENGTKANVVVLGLPQEDIKIKDGTVIINGTADFERRISGLTLTGDWPITTVGAGELLVAILNLGNIDKVFRISLSQLIGKINPVFE